MAYYANNVMDEIAIIGNDGIKYFKNAEDFNLKDNEIYLDIDLYNKMFNETNNLDYYLTVMEGEKNEETGIHEKVVNLKRPFTHLQEVVSTEVINRKYGTSIKLDNLVIKGIVVLLDDNDRFLGKYNMFLSQNKTQLLSYFATPNTVWVRTDSIGNVHNFIKENIDEYGLFPSTPVDEAVDYFEGTLYNIKVPMLYISGIMSIVAFLLVISLISQNIYNRKKEIGILKSIGARNGNLFKIYIYEGLILSFLVFLLSVIGSIAIIYFINKGLIKGWSPDFIFLYYKYFNGILDFFCVFSLVLLGSIIPFHQISKMNPINAIRN
jgi:ABC-type antimicrobial peptide transport system permease subunit